MTKYLSIACVFLCLVSTFVHADDLDCPPCENVDCTNVNCTTICKSLSDLANQMHNLANSCPSNTQGGSSGICIQAQELADEYNLLACQSLVCCGVDDRSCGGREILIATSTQVISSILSLLSSLAVKNLESPTQEFINFRNNMLNILNDISSNLSSISAL